MPFNQNEFKQIIHKTSGYQIQVPDDKHEHHIYTETNRLGNDIIAQSTNHFDTGAVQLAMPINFEYWRKSSNFESDRSILFSVWPVSYGIFSITLFSISSGTWVM